MKARNCSRVSHGAVFVAGSVNKVNTPILVDSDSTVTILRRELQERGEKPGMQKLAKLSGPVVVANGETLHIIGTSEADILIAGKTFKHRVLIADAVSQDCLPTSCPPISSLLTSTGESCELLGQVLR